MIKKKSGLLLLLAWLTGLLGLALGLLFEPIWFARFGSLIVLFSAMSEYSLLHNELNRLYSRLENTEDNEVPDLTPSRWHQKKVFLTHITLIVGTLIWGFGDLLL